LDYNRTDPSPIEWDFFDSTFFSDDGAPSTTTQPVNFPEQNQQQVTVVSYVQQQQYQPIQQLNIIPPQPDSVSLQKGVPNNSVLPPSPTFDNHHRIPSPTPTPNEKSNEGDEFEDTHSDFSDEESEEEDEPPRKRAKKEIESNKAISKNTPTPQILLQYPDQVIFTRDQLLNIGSDFFEKHLQKIQAHRKLTHEEQKAAQKQKRLIKNRESAQASRRRKKSYHEVLESRMVELTTVTSALKQDTFTLTSENAVLKDEVKYLSQLVKNLQLRKSTASNR